MNIQAWVLSELTHKIPAVDWNTTKGHYQHLWDVYFPEVGKGPVIALLGMNAIGVHASLEERHGGPG